jgi:hypothetical protein
MTAQADAGTTPPENNPPPTQKWQITCRIFRGTFATWDQLFSDAAAFATEIGSERVLNISHSADRGDGVVAVWYWALEADKDTENET